MEKSIKLTTKQVPRHLQKLDGYNGRKFKAVITNDVTIPIDAGLWSGGSREYYFIYHEHTRQASPILGQNNFYDGRKESTVTLATPEIVVIRHSLFMGKDTGLTFFIHPDSEWAHSLKKEQ